jgi:hypothetical protein
MVRLQRVFASLCITAVVLTGALAAPAAAEWKRLDSPNFVVVGDVGAGDLKNIARRFEAFRETLSLVLTPAATATAVPTVVMVFPSDSAFTPFKPRYNGKPVGMTGLFMPRQDANYIAIVRDLNENAMRGVFHEYAHLLISNISDVVPVWLNEGLAEFHSTLDVTPDGREVLIGKAVPGHVQLLNGQRLLPLEELVKIKQDSPLYNEGERRSTFYAQSWGLTHLILLGQPPRRDKLAAYLDRLASGTPELDAWQGAFGADRMDRELNEYTGRSAFTAYRIKFPEKLGTFDNAAVTPMHPADAEAVLANFLVQQQRNDEALQRLDRLPPADANRPWVNLVRGMLESTRADDSATKRLSGLDPADDWLLAYLAGSTLAEAIENRRGSAQAADEATVKRLFQVAAKSGREIPNMLARTLTLELLKGERPSDQTMLAFQRGLKLSPGRTDYLFLYARAHAQRSSYPSAIALLRTLTGNGHPPNVREEAQRALQSLEQAQRAAAAAEAADRDAASAAASRDRETDGAAQPGAVQHVFRRLEQGEQRFEGTLQNIECSGRAVVFHVTTSDGPVVARAPTMAQVEFITYREDLSGKIGCGTLKQPMQVYVTWRPAPDGKTERLAVAVEFLPKPE